MSRVVLPSLAHGVSPGRHRLHSRGFTLYTRGFALLLLIGVYQVVLYDIARAAQRGFPFAIVEGSVHVLSLLALAWFIWFRSKPVFATKDGLEVDAGKKRRLIPWSRVLDVREVPWIRFSLSWYPRMWQVDLDRNERFDFCGTRKAHEIVQDYVKQSEARAERGMR